VVKDLKDDGHYLLLDGILKGLSMMQFLLYILYNVE